MRYVTSCAPPSVPALRSWLRLAGHASSLRGGSPPSSLIQNSSRARCPFPSASSPAVRLAAHGAPGRRPAGGRRRTTSSVVGGGGEDAPSGFDAARAGSPPRNGGAARASPLSPVAGRGEESEGRLVARTPKATTATPRARGALSATGKEVRDDS